MTAMQKRRQLAKLANRILDEDLDLALRVMMDFAIRALNTEEMKRQRPSLQGKKVAPT